MVNAEQLKKQTAGGKEQLEAVSVLFHYKSEHVFL